jgi:hypothetical protein
MSVTIGLLLVLVGGTFGQRFVSPGDVTFQHSEVSECRGCHGASGTGVTGWLRAAFGVSAGLDDSKRCLACHDLGDHELSPHSLPKPRLAALSDRAAAASAPARPLALTLAEVMLDPPHVDWDEMACMTCHEEHRGKDFDLTAMSNQRCMACHSAKFVSLSDGHPEFVGHPFSRRTRIFFDHATHLGKHFSEKDFREKAPRDCKACHGPDMMGQMMLAGSFEATCAACHAGQIEGSGRATSPGVAVITVPGLDVAVLRERGAAIGGWPEYADGAITPFMEFLLMHDPDFREAGAALAGVDLLDLTDASEMQIAAVERLAWNVKHLLFDLTVAGMPMFKNRLEEAMGRAVQSVEFAELAGLLPVDTMRGAQREWFPSLLDDVQRHRGGASVPMPASPDDEERDAQAHAQRQQEDTGGPAELDRASDEEIAAEKGEEIETGDEILTENEDEILTADEDEILIEDEILTEEDEEVDTGTESETGAYPEEDIEVKALVEMAEGEAWSMAGGWYREGFTLRYRPTGHADAFLRSWLDATGRASTEAREEMARRLFDRLAARDAPGLCTKCHSVDALARGELVVNWHGARPVPNRRKFTTFRHTAHFSLLDEKGCLTCHGLDRGADAAAGFKDRDPLTFASNFMTIRRETCAKCHTAAKAGDSCVICHNYHVGTFPPTVASTPKMAENIAE